MIQQALYDSIRALHEGLRNKFFSVFLFEYTFNLHWLISLLNLYVQYVIPVTDRSRIYFLILNFNPTINVIAQLSE